MMSGSGSWKTLEAQDEIIRRFVKERPDDELSKAPLASWELVYRLGAVGQLKTRPSPNAALWPPPPGLGVPIFLDSLANHSLGMNLVRTDREGYPIQLSAQRDVFDSAAIPFSSGHTGFVELGGGGPKNFIQQTGPTISQILGVDFEGADRGAANHHGGGNGRAACRDAPSGRP